MSEQPKYDYSLVNMTAVYTVVYFLRGGENLSDVRYQVAYNPQPAQLTTNQTTIRELPALAA